MKCGRACQVRFMCRTCKIMLQYFCIIYYVPKYKNPKSKILAEMSGFLHVTWCKNLLDSTSLQYKHVEKVFTEILCPKVVFAMLVLHFNIIERGYYHQYSLPLSLNVTSI